MVIDFHTHTFPERIVESTIAKLEKSASLTALTDGTVKGLVKSMKEGNIDISIVLPVVTNPVKAEKINASAAEINNTYKNIISFGGIHPDTENYKEVLKNAKEMGLRGIKLHPEYQQVAFDDIRCMRIVDYAEQLGMITVVHAGYDASYPDFKHSGIKNMLNVIENVKPKRLVLAHMGGCNIWSDVKRYIAGADVYFDTAFSFGKKQTDGLLTEEEFIDLARAHGIKKVLFATDSPWGEQKEMAEFVKNSGLSKDEKDDVLFGNAEKLLGIDW